MELHLGWNIRRIRGTGPAGMAGAGGGGPIRAPDLGDDGSKPAGLLPRLAPPEYLLLGPVYQLLVRVAGAPRRRRGFTAKRGGGGVAGAAGGMHRRAKVPLNPCTYSHPHNCVC